MKPGSPQLGERRGLYCPKCGDNLSPCYVAQSYASPAGQFRVRVCRGCGAEVESTETVVGTVTDFIDVTGLNPDQLRLIRQMLAQFRREIGAVIDMRHARVPPLRPALPER